MIERNVEVKKRDACITEAEWSNRSAEGKVVRRRLHVAEMTFFRKLFQPPERHLFQCEGSISSFLRLIKFSLSKKVMVCML
jgi:hypothetical protein